MYEMSKLAQVTREMERYRLDILGISECRWTGSGRQTTSEGSVVLYSGHEDKHMHGVALIVSKEKAKTLVEWEPWRRSLQDVRVCRGADANSNHYLVTAHIKLKLRKVKQQGQRGRQLDIGKLKCQNINKEFVLELRNRFGALGTLADSTDEDPDIHTKWETIKNTYVEAATKILGYRDKKNKEWLTPGTWQKIEQRKQLKAKVLNTKSLRLQKQVQEAYKTKDKEVKKSAKNDKRAFVEMLACNAEGAARRGEMGVVLYIKSPNSSVAKTPANLLL
ncbi:hypothetical protein AAFF_G00116830 [Aldrovandia affinis]|uniref:Endonuclease-reverse transcriptase n=1 Tax=Aldrovandia affinis TaxID=143900 RepID=A0AAD7T2R2_9TELE|nr:hypothetical protein AAFF_G00116830 [Aldrovandia affinis]